MRSIAGVLKGVLPIFVTLTYPAEWPGDEREWKRQLEAVWKRKRQQWPDASAFWRLEFQKRGAPHFHLLLYNVSWSGLAAWEPGGRRWLDRAWYEVVESGDEKHLLAGPLPMAPGPAESAAAAVDASIGVARYCR